jgi:hypothetical protein
MRTIAKVLLALSLSSVLLASAGPAGAAGNGRFGFGDSVMLGARSELAARGIRIDASVSRQFSALPRVIRARRNAGHLPTKVIIHMGNNGYIDPGDCDAAVRAAGRSRHVYLVTLKVPRGWRATNNTRLRACANRHNNASLVDWFSYSVNHGSWFAHDLYHLTNTGAHKYAAFIASHTN